MASEPIEPWNRNISWLPFESYLYHITSFQKYVTLTKESLIIDHSKFTFQQYNPYLCLQSV